MKRHLVFKQIVFAALLMCGVQSTLAKEESHFDRITFSVDASADVANDTLVAVLYVQREGSDVATLSDEVNKIITQAVQRSKKIPGIDVRTRAYQSYPIYKEQRISGWRVRQSIQLKNQNIDALSKLIGDLQSTLAVESIVYTVSPAQREIIEERLIGEAITAFKNRAQQISQHFNRASYRLVTIDVRATSGPVQPIPMRAATTMMKTKVAPPTIEPGTQLVTVKASGVIELVVK